MINPPTHEYNFFTMHPKGPLKERQEIIDEEFPYFFSGDELLDVACNIGYFSFYNKKKFKLIIGIDINKECIDYCNSHNKNAHMTFVHSSFRDFSSPFGFEKIFIGNAAHHIFLATKDWSWLAKLHALSNGYVLIEGAPNTNCQDIRELIPPEYHAVYNMFMNEISKYFTLEKQIATTNYTPDRYFMLFKKRQVPQYQLRDLPIKKILHLQDFKTYKSKDNLIVKVFQRNPNALQLWNGFIRIRLACNSSITNGMNGEVYVGHKLIGWTEKKLSGKTFRYFENETELWNKICDHNIFLSKNGYVDLDSATINFDKSTHLLFDKSCVFPIKHLGEESVNLYEILYNQSYRRRGSFIRNIMDAILSKDSFKVEKSFTEAKI